MENRKLLLKTSTYGCMHVVISFFVAWAVSGSLAIALGISLAEPAVQVLGFALHEKAWNKYGHVKPTEGFDFSPCCAPFTPTDASAPDEDKK